MRNGHLTTVSVLTRYRRVAGEMSVTNILLVCVLSLCLMIPAQGVCGEGPIDSLDRVIGFDEAFAPALSTLHDAWTAKDGYAFLVIGRKLFWAMLLDANDFYAEFSSDSAGFHDYVEELPVTVFRNFNDTSFAHLERLRVVSIERMESMRRYQVAREYLSMHEAVLQKLRSLEVTAVDRERGLGETGAPVADKAGSSLDELLDGLSLEQLYQPPEGMVPDSATAVRIAEAVWLSVYGEEIYTEQPFHAVLWQDSLWAVKGSLPKGMLGGVPYVVIRKWDGGVLGVIHTK